MDAKKLKGDYFDSKYQDKRKYANAHNLEDYIALPVSERERWGFWYKEPSSYLVGGGDFDSFWKKHYPLQYRVREFFSDVKIWLSVKKRQWYERVICRIRPKNKWATQVIPHTWTDKTSLIEEFLFASIVHFVEEEGKTSMVDWNHDERHRDIWRRITNVYNFITVELPEREKQEGEWLRLLCKDEGKSVKEQINSFLANGFKKNKKERKIQLALDLHESETQELIQKNLKEIIDLRPFLWT